MFDVPILLRSYLQTRFRRVPNRAALHTWQAAQMEQHAAWVLRHAPFYRDHWQGLTPAQWAEAPLINKRVMMDNFDRLNTRGVGKEEAFEIAIRAERERNFTPTIKDVTVGLSSGTSGTRGLFLVSKRERLQWAGAVLAKMLPAPLWTRQRIAFFLRANSNLYQTVNSSRLQFHYFDLLDPFAAQLARLNRLHPTILVAPPSMLRLLAEAQAQGQLSIRPTRTIAVAEVLDPVDEKIIAAQFGSPVHQIYQATEGMIATTCRCGTLHLSEDIMVVQHEPLSSDGTHFVPILSDFRRTTQPILRYRLDDVLTLRTTPCHCGSPFTALERIEGRSDDLFYLRSLSGRQLTPLFPDFVRRVILHAVPDVTAYHVRQRSADDIEIALDIPITQKTIAEAAIQAAWHALCQRTRVVPATLHFTYTLPDRPADRKLKRIERLWDLPR